MEFHKNAQLAALTDDTTENDMDKAKLIDRVIEQIKTDVLENDYTVLECLLLLIPDEQLKSYLPEEE